MNKEQDPSNGKFSGAIDPEIAGLMGLENEAQEPETVDVPQFNDLFGGGGAEEESPPGEGNESLRRSFQKSTEIQENPKPFFQDAEFYKKVLSGEGDISKKLHSYFSAYLTTQDIQERSMYRERIIPVFWELLGKLALKVCSDLSEAKRVFLRFSVLLPTAISAEQRDMLSRVVWDNASGEPIFYVDEWLRAVARGLVSSSAQDETKKAPRDDRNKISMLIERAKGKYDAQVGLIRNRVHEIENLENHLLEKVNVLCQHETRSDIKDLKLPYSEMQRSSFNDIGETLRRLGGVNKDLARYHSELDGLKHQYEDLKRKEKDLGEASVVDNKVIAEELNTVRQMAKMCIGRQGNHFPILLKQYFRANIRDIATRENVINLLADLEYLDPGVFLRTFKQQTNRIVPNIILIPCYGEIGVCWEPFERFNRATGRGRIALPIFPKDLKTAVVTAMADLRWQVAKEKAQHYWMEEGLTGWYYQWFSDRKMKGDVREAFIQDYILWMTKESEGLQKLDKDVRGIFWRYLPFPQEVKDKLKTRGFVYAELCKKDQNRAMSDGY